MELISLSNPCLQLEIPVLSNLGRTANAGFHRPRRDIPSLKICACVKHCVIVVTEETDFPSKESCHDGSALFSNGRTSAF